MSFPKKTTSYTTTTREDIIKSGGIIYDPTASFDKDAPLKLPNIPELLTNIETVLEYMCTSEMIKLKKEDEEEFKAHMENKFTEMSSKHYSTFQKIISGEDLTMLFKMLEALTMVRDGHTDLETIGSEIGGELKKQFVKNFDSVKLNKTNKYK